MPIGQPIGGADTENVVCVGREIKYQRARGIFQIEAELGGPQDWLVALSGNLQLQVIMKITDASCPIGGQGLADAWFGVR